MCGRFTLTADWGLVREWFFIELAERMEMIAPRYNIAPGQDVLAVIAHEGVRRAGFLRWGMRSARGGTPLINARAETLAERPAFRRLLERRRCLIPADGYYEWKKTVDGKKQPYRIVPTDGPLFSFAALYDTYVDEDGTRHHSCVIVTTEPNRRLAAIHDRMPAILRREDESLWLDRTVAAPDRLLPILRPYPDEAVRAYPVASFVGNVRRDDPGCIEEIAAHDIAAAGDNAKEGEGSNGLV